MRSWGRGARPSRRIGGLVAVAILATACGNENAESAPSLIEAANEEQPSAVVDVVAELDYFGDLAVFNTEPITAQVDSTAARIALADGATVDVPAGAFAAPTVLTVGIAELDIARFEDNALTGKVYVLATVEDVDLASPVTLEVPTPPDAVRVLQQVDGDWQHADVPPGDTTRVPVPGFSTVSTVVVEVGAQPPAQTRLAGGDSPADFLLHCSFAVSLMFDDDPDDGYVDGYAVDLALSLCAAALVDRLSPFGTYVSVACVGDRIDAAGDIESAIASCAEDSETGQDVPDAPVDIGPLEWSGEMAPTQLGHPFSPDGPATVLIIRTPGTDEFEIVMGASIAATGSVTGCVTTQDWTYEATGSIVYDGRIDFSGLYINDRGGTCTDDAIDQEFSDYAYIVEITDTGLAGPNFEGFTFELPGVPQRIGG